MNFGANKTSIEVIREDCSDYYELSVNKCIVKCGILSRFWENKGWVIEIDPFG